MSATYRILHHLPIPLWLRSYSLSSLPSDIVAGLITAVLLVPQGLAYASLAGLPAEVGLYAGILPPVVYALLGSSRVMSVGPVSIAALLVAEALASVNSGDSPANYLNDALLLAAMSGIILLIMAALRLDFLTHFVGHPVLSGFTSGAAVLIILSQLSGLTGFASKGTQSADSAFNLAVMVSSINWVTTSLGVTTILLLLLFRSPLVFALNSLGIKKSTSKIISRVSTVFIIIAAVFSVKLFDLASQQVQIVGHISSGLPAFTFNFIDVERGLSLFSSAFLIALIGYVESISIAKVLAFRNRTTINSNKELVALGVSNLAAAVSGGMPVAGGFSRSVVNLDAGAKSQIASIVAAILVTLIVLFFTHWFYFLPKAVLSAIIVVAVFPLIDWRLARDALEFDKGDGLALMSTFLGVVFIGIEVGLILGVLVAVAAFMWRASRPHIAVLGRLPGTTQYRNVLRYKTEVWPHLLVVRVDRSLYFANIGYVESFIQSELAKYDSVRHIVFSCSGVNEIDFTAMEALERLAENLLEEGVALHFSDVKGPVYNRLSDVGFWQKETSGQIFISTDDAVKALATSKQNTEQSEA